MPLNPIIGQIMPVAFGSIIPKGWRLCDGSLLGIAQNQALFSLIGLTYGGNGTTTFALPDLRGRAIFGIGEVPLGQVAGTTAVTLSDGQLPAHNHSFLASTTAGTGRGINPTGKVFGTNTQGTPVEMIFAGAGSGEVPLASGTNVTPTGGNQSHPNMQPYLATNYMIAISGVFPTRN